MDSAVRRESGSRAIDRETLLLGAGDVGLVAGLIVLGRLSHSANPIAEPIATLETMAPFVIGWLVVAALAGFYTRPIASSTLEAARLTAVVWIAAANVGLLLRTALFDETAAWPFPLVITGFGLLLLVGWRVAYAAIVPRTG